MDKIQMKPSCQPWYYAPTPTKLNTGECTSCIFYDGVDNVCMAFEFTHQERSLIRHICNIRYGELRLNEIGYV